MIGDIIHIKGPWSGELQERGSIRERMQKGREYRDKRQTLPPHNGGNEEEKEI